MAQSDQPKSDNDFANRANAQQRGFFGEIIYFLMHNKKWWLAPIIVILLLVGVLVILGGTALAPFIYTLF
jgi:Family of unknown function (DUF5989)